MCGEKSVGRACKWEVVTKVSDKIGQMACTQECVGEFEKFSALGSFDDNTSNCGERHLQIVIE